MGANAGVCSQKRSHEYVYCTVTIQAHGVLLSVTSPTALTTIAAMEVAKRLTFDPTDTLTSGLQDPSQQRFHTADMAALQDLQQ